MRKYIGYILTALISGTIGTAFIGIRMGYNVIGFMFLGISAAAIFFLLMKLLAKKHEKAPHRNGRHDRIGGGYRG